MDDIANLPAPRNAAVPLDSLVLRKPRRTLSAFEAALSAAPMFLSNDIKQLQTHWIDQHYLLNPKGPFPNDRRSGLVFSEVI